MKRIATVAMMLNLGVAGMYAQQSVVMRFSGTSAASTINLQQPGTSTGEDNFAGNGTLGAFTFRNVTASTASPQPSPSSCSGSNQLYFVRVAGAGVLLFQDGSLLKVNLMQGADCIDLAAGQATCTMTLKITGGTGRFKAASGTLTLTETVLPVLADASNSPVFFASTGEFAGTVSGMAAEGAGQESGAPSVK